MLCDDPFVWRLLIGCGHGWTVIDARAGGTQRTTALRRLPPDGRLIIVCPPGRVRETARELAADGLVEERRVVLQVDREAGRLAAARVTGGPQPAWRRISAELRLRWRGDEVALICRRRGEAPAAHALEELLQPFDRGTHRPSPAIHRGSGGVFRVMGAACVARFPASNAAIPRCRANYLALERLSRVDLPFAVPRPLAAGSYGDLPYLLESRIGGAAFDYQRESARSRDRVAAAATSALIAFQRATGRRASFGGDHFARLVEQPAARLGRALDARTVAALDSYVERLRPLVRDRIVPLAFMHGDFKVGNLLVTAGHVVSGVVDWDLSCRLGFPVVDYAFYRAFDHTVQRRAPFAACLAALVGDHDAGPLGDGAYSAYCRSIGIDLTLFDAGVVMALVHFGNNHPGLLDDPARAGWCEEHLSAHLFTACAKAAARLATTDQRVQTSA
jgi:aminoglycoside phosphotransferase (APT) family kinase protein